MKTLTQVYQETTRHRKEKGLDTSPLIMFAEAWDYKQKEVESLHNLINYFISELDITAKANESSDTPTWWKGFGCCADASKRLLIEKFNQLKENTNEH